MSQTLPALAPWPAARRTGGVLVAHPAWEAARNTVLDHAAEGPVTVALVGPPGVGKTFLLRELAGCLGDHGFPTMMLMHGDLPLTLIDNAALLVDETLRMPEAPLDELLAQRRAVVVLADVEQLEEIATSRSDDAVIVPLRRLSNGETRDFIAEWLQQSELPADILEPAALSRLAFHANGTVRLIVELLSAAVTTRTQSGQPSVTAADIDEAAGRGQAGSAPAEAGTFEPPPPEPIAESPPPLILPPRRSRKRQTMFAATALAACVVLGWALLTELSPPSAGPAAGPTLAALPPLSPAETHAPALAVTSVPSPATTAEAADVQAVDAPVIATAAAPPALLADPESVAHSVSTAAALAPVTMATTPIASAPDLPAAVTHTANVEPTPVAPIPHRGSPGIVLLAQQGDTLASMYRDIYRDRAAPPYAEMVAANPSPLKPGAIVIFPEPPGGWSER